MGSQTWEIRLYQTERGATPFLEWLDGLPAKHKAHVRTKLRYLRQIRNPAEAAGIVERLEGWGDGRIYEVRATTSRVPYRPIGWRAEDSQDFILIAGARKDETNRRTRWIPRDVQNVVERRLEEMRDGLGMVTEIDLDEP